MVSREEYPFSQKFFLGRDADLKRLQSAWDRARQGEPQFLILLAESGFGKTRLVQEFYRWLSKTFDDAEPRGYWPDDFMQVEEAMDVNPRFASVRRWDEGAEPPGIPWLWWGLRFSKPGERGSESGVCALERYIHLLEPHLLPILWTRQRRALRVHVLKTAASTLTGLTPVAILTALKDVHDLLKARNQEKEGDERARMGVGALAAEHRQSLAELALDAFQTLLEPQRADAQPVPVILVLDDAQWADRETLDFVEKILARAHLRRWPLLIIATHWEREWNEHYARALPEGTDLRSLANVYRRQEGRYRNRAPIVLQKVPDLAPMIAEALPGLTASQYELILHRADGNPLLLMEIIRFLQRQTILFVNRSTAKALTRSGEEKVRKQEMSLHALAHDRFDALEEHIKDIIGWSSYQGIRFLRDITRAVAAAEELQPRYPSHRVETALAQADNPLALVHHDLKSSLSEFRQVTFHEVAHNYLELDADNVERVRTVIRQVLMQWLNEGRLQDLPRAERMDALQMAVQEFEAVAVPDMNDLMFRSWARALVLLHADYRASYAWSQALQVARVLVDASPETGWPLEVIPFYVQGEELLSTLYEMRDFGRAFQLARQTVIQMREREEGTPISLRDLSISLNNVAKVEFAQGNRPTALDHYQESLEIRRRLRDEFGTTPQSIRDVSIALDNVAGIKLAQEDQKGALAHYQESLDIATRLRDEFGVTPQRLRDMSISLDNIAGIEFAQENMTGALAHYQESLKIRRNLHDDFSPSPQSLRDVSISLDNVAKIELAQGERSGALAHYQESLAIRKRLADEFGATPQSLRYVSISLNNVAKIELAEEDRSSALAHYQESLAIRRHLADEFGATSQSLRDLAMSLRGIALCLISSDKQRACDAAEEALQLFAEILARYSATPQAQQEVELMRSICDAVCR